MPILFINSPSVILVVSLLSGLCAGQIATIASIPQATEATIECPTGCAVAASESTTTIGSVQTVNDGGSSISTSDVYLVYSAYQVAVSSATTANSIVECATVQALPVTLVPQYSVTSPPAVDYAALQYNATTSLIDFLGFLSCSPIFNAPTALIQVANATPTETGPSAILNYSSSFSLSLPSTSPSTTASFPASAARKSLTSKDKIAIAVICSGLIVVLIILGTLAWRRFRKRRITAITTTAAAVDDKDPSSSSEDAQPYLQLKSELEAEDARKHELHAEERRYELAEDSIHEMQDGDQDHELLTEARSAMPSLGAMHELRGEEHSKELEAR